MAAAETPERRAALSAVSLACVLVVAKAIALAGRELSMSAWAPVAYVWQDVAVAAAFALVALIVRRAAIVWTLYGLLVALAAINVPVMRALATPLTSMMLRAAGGALADSVAHYVTAANVGAVLVVAGAGVLLPRVLKRFALEPRPLAIAAAGVVVALGPLATTRVDTRGLHRNAVGALVGTSLPRLGGADLEATAVSGWRESPFGGPAVDDLSSMRGSLAGRNVVLVILESTAARYLGLYGAARDPMPSLSALARQAIVFDRAYAVYPESVKGLFATLCSRYPPFDAAPGRFASLPCVAMADRLKQAGYRTGLFHSGRFEYLGMRGVIENRGFDVLEDAGAIGGQVHSSFGVDESSAVRRILDWIDGVAGRGPFFLTYLPVAGHHPYVTTRKGAFDGSGDFSRYLNALGEADEALGALVLGLRERGLEKRTLFVVFGDHGEAFGQHAGNYAHTMFLYDENVRVPYVIAAPGAIDAGRRVARAASVIDTAPTILDLLGLPVPAPYHGTSLLAAGHRMALFHTDYSLGLLGLADGCWKYVYEIESDRSRLFDVCRDADETEDVAGRQTDRAAAYRRRVRAWAAAQ